MDGDPAMGRANKAHKRKEAVVSPNTKIWRHFVRNRAQLRDYIRKLVSNHADAADLLQEVGLVILHRSDVPSNAQQYTAWCRGVARNVVSHHWRWARRHNEIFLHGDAPTETPDAGLRSTEDIMALRRILVESLGELDDQSRALLTLRYLDGKTSGEIAR